MVDIERQMDEEVEARRAFVAKSDDREPVTRADPAFGQQAIPQANTTSAFPYAVVKVGRTNQTKTVAIWGKKEPITSSQACGSTLFSLAVSIRVKAMAMEWPPRCDPANIQFLRPIGAEAKALSARAVFAERRIWQ